MIRACSRCKNGIPSVDGDGAPFVICALIPPTPITVQTVADAQIQTAIQWVRPPMTLRAYCGQFRLSAWKLLKRHEPRA
jgi:hypothetical protein